MICWTDPPYQSAPLQSLDGGVVDPDASSGQHAEFGDVVEGEPLTLRHVSAGLLAVLGFSTVLDVQHLGVHALALDVASHAIA